MRLPSLRRPLLWCAAFTTLAGCASVPPPAPEPAPVEQTSPPAPTAAPTPTPTATHPWQRARVGDRVSYAFSANVTPVPGGPSQPAALAGRMELEVVAVRQPWVWLKLSFTSDKGEPLPQPLLAQPMLIPVRADETQPLTFTREGTESTEQPSAAGRTWEARRYVRDNRLADGPLEDRLYALEPGPLYLTGGLLSASTTLSGFGAAGGHQLTLLEFREGTESAPATDVPALERPLGPGTWFDTVHETAGSPRVNKVRRCIAAERGFVVSLQGPSPGEDSPPCVDFTEVEVVPLEEEVLKLVEGSVLTSTWPPSSEGKAVNRGPVSLRGRQVPVVSFETPRADGRVRKMDYTTYAADPWAPELSGLALMGRVMPLAIGTERVGAKGQRTPESQTRLIHWGTWMHGGDK
jgi:hypothetical protein